MGQISFSRARFVDVIDEAMPLLLQHWRELAPYQDRPLAVDRDSYAALEAAGKFVAFVARDDAGNLIGYAAFIVSTNLHYSTSGTQANQDVLYLSPAFRGMGRLGLSFITYCDEQLRDDGVQVVCHHEKVAHPALGKLLAHLNYENIERIWARRLDLPGG
jgi:hypothetical protein